MSLKSQTHRRRANKLVSNHSLLAFIFAKEYFICLMQCNSFFRQNCIAFYMKEHINYILVGERHIMRIKRKIHRYRIRKTIIFNGILNKSRCTAMKDKTSLWHTFFIRGLSSKVCKFYKISLPAVFKAAGFTEGVKNSVSIGF